MRDSLADQLRKQDVPSPRKDQTFCTKASLGRRILCASSCPRKRRQHGPTYGAVHHDQNIHRYRKLLWRASDEGQRQVLLELLADEEAKQVDRRLPNER